MLFGWFAANTILGDRIALLGMVTTLAVFLFTPLPLTAFVAFFARKRDLVVGTILGAIIFLGSWGGLFVPRLPVSQNNDNNPTLTVMTYNVLGQHNFSAPVINVIRKTNADVVFLQEVNPVLAEAILMELTEVYPYQILDPQETVEGMGTISRYPIQLTGEKLTKGWVGIPQIIELDFYGTPIILVNVHTHPYRFDTIEVFRAFNKNRLDQAHILSEFAKTTRKPLILAGDANTSSLNETYRILLRTPLKDAWREAGFGFGHTFPGSNLPGSSRPKIGNFYFPQWLVRIDYIFCSPHWEVISTELAPFDGVSDHRGVIAQLYIK